MRIGRLLHTPTVEAAVVSLSESVSLRRKQYLPQSVDSPLFNILHARSQNVLENSEEQVWDTENCVRRMDEIWNASFYDFVKDEENVECIARHLTTIVKDYKVSQVASGLIWLIRGWSIESVAKLLRFLFQDWVPDLAGVLCAQLTVGWPLKPDLCLLLAFILNGEPADVSATFIRSLTSSWNHEIVTKLISYLDTVLEWNDDFFKEFTRHYLACLKDEEARGLVSENVPEEMLRDLADLYKSNLAVTNMRLLLANARLAIAEYNLNSITHTLDCQACRNSAPCAQAHPAAHLSEELLNSMNEMPTTTDPNQIEYLLDSLRKMVGPQIVESSLPLDASIGNISSVSSKNESLVNLFSGEVNYHNNSCEESDEGCDPS